ncbi:MAG: phosphatase PAP2 family protein, partial [Bacteroidales bacterium]
MSTMKSAYKINLLLVIVFLLCFAFVLLTGMNKALFLGINSLGSNINPFIWANLTFLGDTMTACAIMLLFIRKRPDLIWSGIIATLIATLIVNIIKSYFDIPRPPATIDRNLIFIVGPSLYRHSFPSGHTVTIFALTGILMFYFRSLLSRLGMILLAFLVGISRIAVGVHWPADVLAGAALGIVCATTGVFIVTKLGWNMNKTVQLITGFLLILLDLDLMIFYDSKYEQAIYLQSFIAFTVLVAGIREYYLLL